MINQFQSSQDVKLIQRYMLMLHPELPIVLDQAQEITDLKAELEAKKQKAVKEMQDQLNARIAVFGKIIKEEGGPEKAEEDKEA